MIVIGADTHKDSHALAAVDEGTGKVRGGRQIKADEPGHLAAVRWARSLDEERVWAIEDCRHVSRRLEQALLAAGERVIRVPPHRMGTSRKGEREPGKSDEIDALAVARAVVKDGVEQFPVAYLNKQAMEIRLLLDQRGALNNPRTLDRVDRRLHKQLAGARARIAREQVRQLRGLNREIEALQRELAELVTAHRPSLLAEQGCGAVTAAILIGHTAGNATFRSDASFALQSGTAPIPCSSGQRTQHRLNRGGDRQLNHALHIIALARAQHDPATKEYLARKQAEGQTTKGALRCLKRSLARRFYRLLTEPPLTPTDDPVTTEEIPRRDRRNLDTTIDGAAPMPMVCVS
jgi:transposase